VALTVSGQGELPYGQDPPTAGWSGTDTSRERAVREAGDGTAAHRQRRTLRLLNEASYSGLTSPELEARTGWHHGQASSVLSVLNLAERIVMLEAKRDRCHVYVLSECAVGRPVAKRKPRRTYEQGFAEGYAEGLEFAADYLRRTPLNTMLSLADLADELERRKGTDHG